MSEALYTLWVQICIVLIILYTLCGVPFLIYLIKTDRKIKHKKIKSIKLKKTQPSLTEVPNSCDIAKHEFGAFFRAGIIPENNEFSNLNELDTQKHVLKYSTGYGARFGNLNRYIS